MAAIFDRPDREKQFLYQLIMDEPDPEYALNNFRQCLARINSRQRYDRFLHSGFQVILRDEDRSIQQTLALAEKAFDLVQQPSDVAAWDLKGSK